MALGDSATVSASNYVRIGNTSVTQIGGQVAWSNLSDARDKENVTDSDLGLDFVTRLRPVKFNFIGQSEIKDGFIAQEVESAAKDLGVTFSAVRTPANEKSRYALSYAEFVVPIVNAIKELKNMLNDVIASITGHDKAIEEIRAENKELKAQNEQMKQAICEMNPNANICREPAAVE